MIFLMYLLAVTLSGILLYVTIKTYQEAKNFKDYCDGDF